MISMLIVMTFLATTFVQAQNVGVGANSPSKGKLVVRGTVGGVAAMFGDTTSGVAIENAWPGLALNSYFNGSRRSISNGYGGLVGLNPGTGDFHIMTGDSVGVNAPMNLSYRLFINKEGNIGVQGNTNPYSPLSFANLLGEKISLYSTTSSSHFGMGIQPWLMQFYTSVPEADIAFGHGGSADFTENMRIRGDGRIGIGTSTPAYPVTLQKEGDGFVQKGANVEVGTATTVSTGIIKTFTNHALQFATGANGVQMTLTNTGRLGIGTAAPLAKVEISSNSFNLLQLTNTQSLGAGKDVLMVFRTGSFNTGSIGTRGETVFDARLAFGVGDFLTEKMTIKANGFVGINNTNPGKQLETNGDSKFNGNMQVTGTLSVGKLDIDQTYMYTVEASDISANGKKAILDIPAFNNQPNMTLIVTKYSNEFSSMPVRAVYDANVNKWCLVTNGWRMTGITSIGVTNCSDNCQSITVPILNECAFTAGEQYLILAFY